MNKAVALMGFLSSGLYKSIATEDTFISATNRDYYLDTVLNCLGPRNIFWMRLYFAPLNLLSGFILDINIYLCVVSTAKALISIGLKFFPSILTERTGFPDGTKLSTKSSPEAFEM